MLSELPFTVPAIVYVDPRLVLETITTDEDILPALITTVSDSVTTPTISRVPI
jgi:hypothetical protein